MRRILLTTAIYGAALCLFALVLMAVRIDPALHFGLALGRLGADFGSAFEWAASLSLAGLAVVLAYRAGMLNLGVAGQAIVGAAAACRCGAILPASTPRPLAVLACFFAAALAGGLWGGAAGLLRCLFRVPVALTTLLSNRLGVAVALTFSSSLCRTAVPGSVAFSLPLGARGSMPAGLLLAVAAACLVAHVMSKTRLGLEMRAVAQDEAGASALGVRAGRTLITAMVMSGALAGMAGAERALSLGGFTAELGAPLGLAALVVAALAWFRVMGVLGTALVLSFLRVAGGSGTGLADQGYALIEGFLLLFAMLVVFGRESGRVSSKGKPALRRGGA